MYTYIYIHIYTYIYLYIYTYTQVAPELVPNVRKEREDPQRSTLQWCVCVCMCVYVCVCVCMCVSRYAARSSVYWRWRSGPTVPSGEPLIRVRGKSSTCRLLLRQVCMGKQTVARVCVCVRVCVRVCVCVCVDR